jgi:hypothetical protein
VSLSSPGGLSDTEFRNVAMILFFIVSFKSFCSFTKFNVLATSVGINLLSSFMNFNDSKVGTRCRYEFML